MTLFETAIMTVYNGFQVAVMKLEEDLYNADQTFGSAKQGAEIQLLIDKKLEGLMATKCLIHQDSLERREGQYCDEFLRRMVAQGLDESLEGILKDFIVNEAEFQFELQRIQEEALAHEKLFARARDLQKRVLCPANCISGAIPI